jgi:hypothetical protein
MGGGGTARRHSERVESKLPTDEENEMKIDPIQINNYGLSFNISSLY